MSPFHFCLSAAKNLSSFQLLPASLITDLLQVFLGLPLFLFPWGFQSRAAFGISPSSFLNVWPIHLNFLFLISKFISSCPVTFHRSLLEIIFGHNILNIYLRHLFTKVCILCRIYITIMSFVFGRFETVKINLLESSVQVYDTPPNQNSPKTTPQLSNRDQYLAVSSVCCFNVGVKHCT